MKKRKGQGPSVAGHFTQELDIRHGDLVVAALSPVLQLDNAIGAVDAEQQADRALVVAMDDHDLVSLDWQHRL